MNQYWNIEREYSLLRVVKVNKGLNTQKGKTRNIGGNCPLMEKISTLSTPFWLPESSLSLSSCYLKRTAAASQQTGRRVSEQECQRQMPFNHVIPGWFSGSWPKRSDPPLCLTVPSPTSCLPVTAGVLASPVSLAQTRLLDHSNVDTY